MALTAAANTADASTHLRADDTIPNIKVSFDSGERVQPADQRKIRCAK
jgi:hypothetical protein